MLAGPQGIEIIDPAPHSEEIVGRFIWSQFDLSRQSVYFLYLRSSQQNSLGYDTMLKCVQFTSKNRYDVKMDIMLPMEVRCPQPLPIYPCVVWVRTSQRGFSKVH